MAVYRTTKCPYCSYILENHTATAKELIGSPLATCPSCKRQYKTGMKYWDHMSGGEKIWYILRSIGLLPMTIIFYTIMATVIPGILLNLIFDFDLFSSDFFFTYISIIAVLLTVLYIYNIIASIKYKGDEEWKNVKKVMKEELK